MDFLNIINEDQCEFEEIANTLFNKFAIQTNSNLYRLIEIEFYWNSMSHVDSCTYPRKHVNPKTGDWFFHYSGVDIALKNEKTGGYGGILIRGILDVNTLEKFKGPQVCVMKLFSETNAFSESIKTMIVKHQFDTRQVINKPRVGLGNNAIKDGADKSAYNFSIIP